VLRSVAGLLLALTALAQPTARNAGEFLIHRVGAPDLKLSSYRGKVVVLAFLNTGCSHCQHFAQELAEFQRDYGPKGVQVLSVVFDKGAKDQLASFRDKYVHGFPVGYSDEATVMEWLGQSLDQGYFAPIVAFIDRRGRVDSQHMGDDNLFQDPDGNIRHTLDRLVKQTTR